MMHKGPIDREYAIEQMDLAIAEAKAEAEREQFRRFKDFLMVCPTPKEVKERKGKARKS